MILRLMLELPEDLAYVRITRVLGRALLEHLQAEKQDIDDVETLVGELCSNVLRHAQSNASRFQVTLEYHSDFVTVTVKYQGAGFSLADVPPAGTARADFGGGERLGGFGMQLIHSLSDNLVFHRTDPHGMTVCVEKKLHYRSENAASAVARLNNADGQAHITLD